jgi:hypothetical protein
MPKETRKQLFTQIEKLWGQVFPDEPFPRKFLDKTYEVHGELHAVAWGNLIESHGLEGSSVQHLIGGYNLQHLDHVDQVHPELYSHHSCRTLYTGEQLLAILDNLRKQLGPDPKKALVLDTDDEVLLVRERLSTLNELTDVANILETAAKEKERKAQLKADQSAQAELDKKRLAVLHAAEKLGFDTALRVLKAAG